MLSWIYYSNSFNFAENNVATMVEVDKNEFVMCTLNKSNTMQQPIDLNFMKGTEVAFFTQGKGSVHLTGFLIPDEDAFGDYGEEEEDSSDG
jgi:FK506-binding nuclear protein